MNILLMKPINSGHVIVQPSLGLGYIASVLIRQGHAVEILDPAQAGVDWSGFRRFLDGNSFDVVGLQMFGHEIESAKAAAALVKEVSPRTRVIVGGAHVSAVPEETMKLMPEVDYAFTGEAERGVEQFFSGQGEGGSAVAEADLSAPNLVYRRNGSVLINPRRPFEDLDEIPLPAWHLMRPDRYPLVPHGVFCRQAPIAPMIISRGCPFPCTFCAGKTVTGSSVRYRSVANALEEITLLRDSYGVREVRIEDDNFTLRRDYVHSFCEAVLSRSPGLSLALPNGVRLDSLDEPTLKLMERAGFYSMAVGIESGSDRVLAMMRKEITSEGIREKIALIKKATRILVTGFFVLGYPGETVDDIEKTISFARTLPLDAASFMFLMPLPGCELWEAFKAKNRRIEWQSFFYYRIVEGLSDIPTPLLKRLRKKAVISFYARPSILWGFVRQMRSVDQAAILAKRVAAAFFCS